ncbi:hypothetical protein [Thermococcus sp.]|uniref:hypothetical protein n=1 Tax=Thermococcus sp. TaxID=35749 RepID=UPI0026068FFD|nr:hypothetical protein [Thermococcus sp.]
MRNFGEVVSFRVLNLQLPSEIYAVLRENGILVDSSKTIYKGWHLVYGWCAGNPRFCNFLRIEVSKGRRRLTTP